MCALSPRRQITETQDSAKSRELLLRVRWCLLGIKSCKSKDLILSSLQSHGEGKLKVCSRARKTRFLHQKIVPGIKGLEFVAVIFDFSHISILQEGWLLKYPAKHQLAQRGYSEESVLPLRAWYYSHEYIAQVC